ncbi:Proline dehydrogenase, partial [mine drainage metagenome]
NEIAAKVLAGRWIAGTHADDALAVAQAFNHRRIKVLLNDLGEAYTDKGKVKSTVSKYRYLLDRIKSEKLGASLSVKPSQLGLLIDGKLMRREYMGLVKSANERGIFVWLDMEEHNTVDSTIEMYEESLRYGNTGICIQSYLRRSMEDIRRIVKEGGTIRLVKGAYAEPKEIAFQSRSEVTAHFDKLMDYLFKNSRHFMIATHDLNMVNKAVRMEKRHGKQVMLGMLKGIMNENAVRLAESGEEMHIYVPFGTDWAAYSYRRLTEAGHASLILKSLMKRQRI